MISLNSEKNFIDKKMIISENIATQRVDSLLIQYIV